MIAAVVAVPSGRAVCAAFTAAMRRYGVPSEVLTDNGKQFTGRHTRPQPVEVLFERICRENGILQRFTKIRSPTTTGKVERFHKTIRRELLDHVAPSESLPAGMTQARGWRCRFGCAPCRRCRPASGRRPAGTSRGRWPRWRHRPR